MPGSSKKTTETKPQGLIPFKVEYGNVEDKELFDLFNKKSLLFLYLSPQTDPKGRIVVNGY